MVSADPVVPGTIENRRCATAAIVDRYVPDVPPFPAVPALQPGGTSDPAAGGPPDPKRDCRSNRRCLGADWLPDGRIGFGLARTCRRSRSGSIRTWTASASATANGSVPGRDRAPSAESGSGP
jgi:hypothetical protein